MPAKATETVRTKRKKKTSDKTKLAARKKYHRFIVRTMQTIHFANEIRRALPGRQMETEGMKDNLYQCLTDFCYRYAELCV
jgi:hypothetical protein